MPRLLSCKELAWSLNRNVTYIYAMRRSGFPMPGDRATVEAAIEWLSENPDFSRNKAYRKSTTKRKHHESK
jgi:hypothetical protein